MDALLFLPPFVTSDQSLPEKLQLDGEPVSFLWVVPITTEECNLKLKKGMDTIWDLFEKRRHPYVFDTTSTQRLQPLGWAVPDRIWAPTFRIGQEEQERR